MSIDGIETGKPLYLGDAADTPPHIANWFLAYFSRDTQPDSADSAVQTTIGEITSRKVMCSIRATATLCMPRTDVTD